MANIVKYASLAFMTYCSCSLFNESLFFPNFSSSVQNSYHLVWSAGTFFGYILLLIQKQRIFKCFEEMSKIPQQRGPQQPTANFLFLFANGYQIYHFTTNTYMKTISQGYFKFDCQYYINFSLVLMDFMYADFLLLNKDMFSAIISQIKTVRSNEPFLEKYLLGKLKMFCDRHNRIIDVYEEVTYIFSVLNLVSVSLCLIEIVYSLYATIERVNPLPPYPWIGVFWISTYSIKLLYVAWASTTLSTEVGNN